MGAKDKDPPHFDNLPAYACNGVGKGSVNLVVARKNRDGTVCYASFLIGP